jgi:D-alanyl-D-alanine carboxypeptidase
VTGPSGSKAAPTPPSRTAALEKAKSAEKAETVASRSRSDDPHDSKDGTDTPSPHGGWVIQLGATDAPSKATDLLNRAKSEGHAVLASARPFTEKVRKGDATLYRARFVGLDTGTAEAACKTLKRSGFACIAMRD